MRLLIDLENKPFLPAWGGLVLILMGFPQNATSAQLKGQVRGEGGEPLAFASVYLEGTTKGTTTNQNGRYKLQLKPGAYTVVFQYMGYQQATRSVNLQKQAVKQLDVILKEKAIETETVTVSGRDPAYRIIRNAIDKREAHRKAISQYECQLYTKASVAADSAQRSSVVDDDQLPPGYLYLSESVSTLYYQYPEDYKQEVLSSKVSGQDEAITLNFAFNEPISFYKNRLDLGARRPLVSPIADNALNFYKYKLINTYTEKEGRVHSIRVMPKRSGAPAFRGSIHITAKDWRIHSLSLYLTKANGIQTFDTLQVKQTYLPVSGEVRRLYNQRFRLAGSVMGLQLKARALAQFTEYQIDPEWGASPFGKARIAVPESSTKQDSAYWQAIRPFELTEKEEQDYTLKDSLQQVRNKPSYIDSVDKVRNQPSLLGVLIGGYEYQRRTKNIRVEAPSLAKGFFNFNTVEGWVPDLHFTATRTVDNGPDWNFKPFVRYGFANEKLNGGLAIEREPWTLEGGRDVYQFQQPPSIPRILNTAYTLFDGRNHAKFYQKAFIRGGYNGKEWGNGWFPAFSVRYEERQPLTNSTNYTFSESKAFTPNIPAHPHFEQTDQRQNFPEHQAFILKAGMRYKPGLEYMMLKGEKVNLGTAYPTLSLNYQKAITGIGGSDADYDYLEAGISGNADFQLFGDLAYQASAGQFINQARIPFVDFRHFQGQEVTYQLQRISDFQLLDYYEASTTQRFAEGHFQHEFAGFIWSKLPVARKLQWQVSGVGNILLQDDQVYWEWGAGLDELIGLGGSRFLGVYFFQGYQKSRLSHSGFRVKLSSPLLL